MSLDAALDRSTEKESGKAKPAAIVEELTVRLVKAEEAAWREFYEMYAPRLYRYLLVMLNGNETRASDALQSTFVRAAKHMRPMAEEATLWCWLTVLARSAAFDDARKRSRFARFVERFKGNGSSSVSPPGVETDGVLLEKLERGLARLADSDRVLLTGKYIEGASVRVLAQENELSEKAVESRLTRARRRLRQLILAELTAEMEDH